MAWLARQIVTEEPEYRARPGGPLGISRVTAIFKTIFPASAVAEETEAMRRRLKIILHLEQEGIWPAVTHSGGDEEMTT